MWILKFWNYYKKYFENSCSSLTCLCWLLFGLTKLLLFLLRKVKGKMKFPFFLKMYISCVEIKYWLSVNKVGCIPTFSTLFDDVNSILRVIPNAETEPTVVSSSHYLHLLWIPQTITRAFPIPNLARHILLNRRPHTCLPEDQIGCPKILSLLSAPPDTIFTIIPSTTTVHMPILSPSLITQHQQVFPNTEQAS